MNTETKKYPDLMTEEELIEYLIPIPINQCAQHRRPDRQIE